MPIQIANKLFVEFHSAPAGFGARYSSNSETWSTTDLVDGGEDIHKGKSFAKHLQYRRVIRRNQSTVDGRTVIRQIKGLH